MIVKCYSKGLYANWYFYAPDRLLFDCGEGAAIHLRAGIFAIEKIFLSHGHMDHIAGLSALLALRHSTKGDNDKPLTVYYPTGDRNIEIFRGALEKMLGRFIAYELTWQPLQPEARVPLRKGRVMEAVRVDHPAENPLGYRVLEERRQLKEGLRGLPGPELAKIPMAEKIDRYEAVVAAYSGDSMATRPELYRKAELLIHDCTFLERADRLAPTHATVQEVFDLARDAEVKHLLLTHISPRYPNAKVIRGLIEKADSHGVRYHWVPHNRVFELDG